MSKLIPGNQKHLTLDDRLYIEHSLNEGCCFYTRIRPLSLRRSGYIGSRTHGIREALIILITSVSTDSAAKRQMHVRRSSSVILCAVPAINVTWCAHGSRRNPADGWTGLPLSVMAAPERKTCAPYQRSIITMLMLPSDITKNSVPLPGLMLINPDPKCITLMRLSLLWSNRDSPPT